jgi:hypothetical protein
MPPEGVSLLLVSLHKASHNLKNGSERAFVEVRLEPRGSTPPLEITASQLTAEGTALLSSSSMCHAATRSSDGEVGANPAIEHSNQSVVLDEEIAGNQITVRHHIVGTVLSAAGGAADRVLEMWRDALARVGRETELGTDLVIGYTFHIAETEQKAIAEARPFFEENMKMFAPLGFVRGLTRRGMPLTNDSRICWRSRATHVPRAKIISPAMVDQYAGCSRGGQCRERHSL